MIGEPETPYIGPHPFTGRDPRYRGREADVRVIASNLCAERWTVLYGATGSGKTSIIRAGVLPRVEQYRDWFRRVYFRNWGHAGAIKELKSLCVGVAADAPLFNLVKDDYTVNPDGSAGLLIVLDQFEEYLRHSEQENLYGNNQAFHEEIVDVVTAENLKVNLLVVIRADEMASLDHLNLPGALSNRLRLELLTEADATRAILEPFRQASGRAMRESFVERVVQDLGVASQDRWHRIHPAQLQIVMREYWLGSQGALGDLTEPTEPAQGVLGAYAMRRLQNAIPEPWLRCAAAICAQMIDKTGTAKFARTADELVERCENELETALDAPHEEAVVLRVLEALTQEDEPLLERIVRTDSVSYQLIHDVMARSVRGWAEGVLGRLRRRPPDAIAVPVDTDFSRTARELGLWSMVRLSEGDVKLACGLAANSWYAMRDWQRERGGKGFLQETGLALMRARVALDEPWCEAAPVLELKDEEFTVGVEGGHRVRIESTGGDLQSFDREATVQGLSMLPGAPLLLVAADDDRIAVYDCEERRTISQVRGGAMHLDKMAIALAEQARVCQECFGGTSEDERIKPYLRGAILDNIYAERFEAPEFRPDLEIPAIEFEWPGELQEA